MVNFPTSLDNLTNPTGSDSLDGSGANALVHSEEHAKLNDIVEALEAKVGVDSSAVTSSHDYKIAQLEAQTLVAGANITVTGGSGDPWTITGGAGGGGDAWSDPVDADIVPDADGTRDLGATATRFAETYTDALFVTDNITVGGTVDGRDLAADGTKLDGIESGATADQTTEEIQDAAWAAVSGGTQTGITVTYQDATNDVDFIVGGLTTSMFDAAAFKDEDNMASNLATAVPSQQSVKAYVDASVVGKRTEYISAGSMLPAITSGAATNQVELTTNKQNIQVLDFDATADEYAHFEFAFPKSWNEGTITFQVYWTTSATDTDGVAWALQGVAVSDGDTIDVAYGTAVVVTDDAQSAANDTLITAESSAVTIAGTPAAGDMCYFRIFRDVSDANDDMAEDARLIGIKLFYTTDAASDA